MRILLAFHSNFDPEVDNVWVVTWKVHYVPKAFSDVKISTSLEKNWEIKKLTFEHFFKMTFFSLKMVDFHTLNVMACITWLMIKKKNKQTKKQSNYVFFWSQVLTVFYLSKPRAVISGAVIILRKKQYDSDLLNIR